MKFSPQLKTAITLIISISLLVVMYNFLNSTSIFKKEIRLITFLEDVSGLKKGASVTLQGLTIGKVILVDFVPNSNKIKVVFQVRNNMNFSNKSVAEVYDPSFVGNKFIRIIPNYEAAKIQENDTLQSKFEKGLMGTFIEDVEPIINDLGTTIKGINKLISGINETFNQDKTREDIKNNLKELGESLKGINQITLKVNRLLDENSPKIISSINNIESASSKINHIATSLEKTTSDIPEIIVSFKSTSNHLDKMITSLNNGNGTLGKLLNDSSLYDSLNMSSLELNLLLEDLRENPKRYVHFSLFGRKQKSYHANINDH